MRLWSLHPMYLDAAGLVAVWREGLLAQAVLTGRTRGYTRHPQLVRFRAQPDPNAALTAYLHRVADEGEQRGYAFDRPKLPADVPAIPIEVTDGQLLFEWRHLLKKLQLRSPARFADLGNVTNPLPHPQFVITAGPVEEWERAARSPVVTRTSTRSQRGSSGRSASRRPSSPRTRT
ncbi:MAG TPA: pyrimidine dimer DNA glycosylase/endonuclease V [Thermoanaerobaculia bacterium]|nr:pyrimidine dimer DNA glycosylase/endonuclease V [Thermoanaerobaculia bacterium]